ncbi:hypothetical protein LR48_Vigan06g132100 [Vigna angularis]|uniref:Uncharacterized protein n=1 Tax=Phaseolus angularis TaxID=3914 RepID=A0A0L9UT41_PHAAN|nr:hypothetical protein LR48_Vigan06g132100 [Vigna angularis]
MKNNASGKKADLLGDEIDEDASGGVAAPEDDLEVHSIAADNDEGHEGDDTNENEDQVEKDDYPLFNMKDFLG